MKLRKAVHLFLAGLAGFILGVGLTTLSVLKEKHFWGVPRLAQEQYVKDLKEATDALQTLDLRLRLALTQISRDLERIFGDGLAQVLGPRSQRLFSEPESQRPSTGQPATKA